jgi:hypothetical protein
MFILSVNLFHSIYSFAESNPCVKPVPLRDDLSWNQRAWEDKICNGTHDDKFTFKNKTAYSLDPYVWVYTKEFAERFHMPRQWIDSNLKGALAIAWRMTTIGDITCGLGGRADNCWKPLNCQMDIYFDNRISLPWSYPDVVSDNVRRGLTSADFLHTSPASKAWRYADHGLMIQGGGGLVYGKYNQGGSQLVFFDKEYESNVALVSWVGSGVCPEYTGPEKVLMKFISMSDWDDFRSGKISEKEIGTVHSVEFPQIFLERAKRIYDIQSKPNQDVMQGLIDAFFKSKQ